MCPLTINGCLRGSLLVVYRAWFCRPSGATPYAETSSSVAVSTCWTLYVVYVPAMVDNALFACIAVIRLLLSPPPPHPTRLTASEMQGHGDNAYLLRVPSDTRDRQEKRIEHEIISNELPNEFASLKVLPTNAIEKGCVFTVNLIGHIHTKHTHKQHTHIDVCVSRLSA